MANANSATTSPPGSQGLLFLSLSGPSQMLNPAPGGGFIGLTLAHTRGDMSRAVLEGHRVAGLLIPAVPPILLVDEDLEPELARKPSRVVRAGVVHEDQFVGDPFRAPHRWADKRGFYERITYTDHEGNTWPAALFALDSFAGGFVVQSFAAYWFYLRFGVDPGALGMIFFWANLLAGVSALLASRLAARFGLVKTMVFTHLPSNVLLVLVPLMPTLPLAILVLLARFSISQMDVPTRQSYVMAVVRPEERSAAAGITGVARTTGAAIAPMFAGWMFARPSMISVPFFIAGALKVVYDLLLYRGFAARR